MFSSQQILASLNIVKLKMFFGTLVPPTIISLNMAEALGLQPIKKALIAGIGGNVEAYTYKISLYFPKEGAWIKDLEVLACDLEDNDMIIGMDTITKGDFAITNKDGATWFSFRIPSQEHIEF